MPDKSAAIHEMRRVLASGGQIAIATWCSLEDTPGMLELELNAVVEPTCRPVPPIRVTASKTLIR